MEAQILQQAHKLTKGTKLDITSLGQSTNQNNFFQRICIYNNYTM